MQKIKTLIFDFGDVFINLDKQGAMQNALEVFKLETFETDMIKTNELYEVGKISSSFRPTDIAKEDSFSSILRERVLVVYLKGFLKGGFDINTDDHEHAIN